LDTGLQYTWGPHSDEWHVDSAARALVRIRLTSVATATTMEIEAWIDTGFTGELVLPRPDCRAGTSTFGRGNGGTGDGSATVLEVYSCLIEWFGRVQQIEVMRTPEHPLLGVGLLQGHRLTIDYAARTLTIE